MESETLLKVLLRRYNGGDRDVEKLIPLIYEDLRLLAHQRLRGEGRVETPKDNGGRRACLRIAFLTSSR